jgi:glycosyltransferase involved in cell wall biosynthesis
MRLLRVYPGAVEARTRHREKALRRLGVEVAIMLPSAYGPVWSVDGVEPELPHWPARIYNRHSIPLHVWDPRDLRRAIREFDPEIVDVHEQPSFPAGAEGVLAAGMRPAEQNIAKRYPAPIRVMRRWVFARIAAIHAVSSQARDVVRSWGYEGRISVIPTGVEDEFFRVRSHGERVGFIGRLAPEKGVLDLQPLGSRLLCVGEGPLAGEMRAAGAEVVRARSADELTHQLERMAVLAVPSRTTPRWKEQFGRVVAEAMAAGVPVVAYASGALPETIGNAGLVVTEGDQAGLVQAIEAVLADPGDLGERGRARARERFAWDVVARQLRDLYEEVLAECAVP